jgi:hypothetical protein
MMSALIGLFILREKNFFPQLKLHVKGKSLSIKSKADNAFVAAANVVEKAKRVLRDRHAKSQLRH